MKEGAAKEEAKGKIFTQKLAKVEEEFPQLELIPEGVKQVEIGAIWQNVLIFGEKEGAETAEQETAQKQSPQLEVTPKKVTQIEIEEIRLKLWNFSRSIPGSEDIIWEMLKQ